MATVINAPIRGHGTVTYPKLRLILDSLQFTLDSLISTLAADRVVVTNSSGVITTGGIGYSASEFSGNGLTQFNGGVLVVGVGSSPTVSSFVLQTGIADFGVGGASAGDVRVFGTGGTGSYLQLVASSAGTKKGTISLAAHTSADRTYTIVDAGANANFLMTQGSQTVTGQLTLVATLLPSADNAIDLGSTSLNWRSLYLSTSIKNGSTTLATATELGYLSGVSSAIQTQLNAKATDSLVVHLAGAEAITGAKTFDSSTLLIKETGGGSDTVTIANSSLAASRVYTLLDAGGAANFVLSEGTATVNGAKTFGNVVTITTTTANTLVVSTDQATTEVSIDNTATDGDPFLSWKLGGTKQFSLGVNDGASDVLQLGTTAIDTGTMWQATAAGEITQPLQPSFLATLNTGLTDKTGDNTDYTLILDTEVYDLGADFNLGTSTFTAPVTGKYLLSLTVRQTGILTTHTAISIFIATSNRAYNLTNNYGSNPQTTENFTITVLADMDSGDTATGHVQSSGSTKVIDISGGNENTTFSGSLVN